MASLTVYPAIDRDGQTAPALVVYTVPDVVDTARRISASLIGNPEPRAVEAGLFFDGVSKSTGEPAFYVVKGE